MCDSEKIPVLMGADGERRAKRLENGKKEPYRVIVEDGQGELVEKKSRFIAVVKRVKSEEEASDFIETVKKKHWDASHNCSAFVVESGTGTLLTRCSDDGEPSGTAGRPMLEVLLGEKLKNVAVVVTRYFGGTLLGTGGLVRAYSQAVKEGLKNCVIGTMRAGVRMKVETDYNGIGRILYLLGSRGIEPRSSEYTDKVMLELLFPAEWKEALTKELTEVTAGRAVMEIMEEIYYIDKEPQCD